MNYKETYKPIYENLKREVFDGQYEEIDKIFAKNKDLPQFYSELLNYIISDGMFFMFRNLDVSPGSSERKLYDRHSAVIKNLELEHQLDMLGNVIDVGDISIKHVALLKVNHEEDNTLVRKSSFINKYGTYLLFKENFDKINELQQHFGFNILTAKCKSGVIYSQEPSVFSSKYFYSDIEFYMPLHEIIYNYNEKKVAYLQSQNIALPTIEEANTLAEHIHDYMITRNKKTGYPMKIEIDALAHHLSKYSTYILYQQMQENLPQSEKVMRKSKI